MLHIPESPTFDYQNIITDIAFHAPQKLRVKQRQWIYFHGDISYEFVLTNWKKIILRIWEQHMQDWNENRKLSERWNIFLSAYLIDSEWEKHLPLYGWYQSNDYKEI